MQVFFGQPHILISEACCLIVPLSHNGCLAEFCMYQVINLSYIVVWNICMFVKCWKMFTETVTRWQCGRLENCTISDVNSSLFVSHWTVWQSWHLDWDDVHWKNTWRTELISGLW